MRKVSNKSKKPIGGSFNDFHSQKSSERLSGLNAFEDAHEESEIGVALLKSGRNLEYNQEKVRGYTATNIDEGLSFEDESEDENLITRQRKQGVDLMGSQNRAKVGNSLVSSRSRKFNDASLDLSAMYSNGPLNTGGSDDGKK